MSDSFSLNGQQPNSILSRVSLQFTFLKLLFTYDVESMWNYDAGSKFNKIFVEWFWGEGREFF